jgi:hypothetical protein
MNKKLLNNKEIAEMIRDLYESDQEHILNVHETSEKGLEYCINRTIADYVCNNIKIYSLNIDNKLIAYFGEEDLNGERWLTGFMIKPEMRSIYKKEVWNNILDHFKGQFKVGLYSKNIPGIKFLEKNGCRLIENSYNTYGEGKIFMMECE